MVFNKKAKNYHSHGHKHEKSCGFFLMHLSITFILNSQKIQGVKEKVKENGSVLKG